MVINMKDYSLHEFEEDLSELDIMLDEKQIMLFLNYYELLVEWNSFMNLTSIIDFNDVLKKHFIDSLCLVKGYGLINSNGGGLSSGDGESGGMKLDGIKLLDVGTGAGFPGIPLKIAFPHVKVTLLDSLQKRVKFLDEVIGSLGLDGIEAVHGRAEDYAKPDRLRGKYDLVVSRAVANLSTLSEYCIPFVKKGGIFVSYKSEKLFEEKREAEKAISILGGCVEKEIKFSLPNSDICRVLFVIRKIEASPKKYPRKAGLPAKEPLI